jgi:hypothetical protein
LWHTRRAIDTPDVRLPDAGSKIVPVEDRDHAVMADGEGLGSIR